MPSATPSTPTVPQPGETYTTVVRLTLYPASPTTTSSSSSSTISGLPPRSNLSFAVAVPALLTILAVGTSYYLIYHRQARRARRQTSNMDAILEAAKSWWFPLERKAMQKFWEGEVEEGRAEWAAWRSDVDRGEEPRRFVVEVGTDGLVEMELGRVLGEVDEMEKDGEDVEQRGIMAENDDDGVAATPSSGSVMVPSTGCPQIMEAIGMWEVGSEGKAEDEKTEENEELGELVARSSELLHTLARAEGTTKVSSMDTFASLPEGSVKAEDEELDTRISKRGSGPNCDMIADAVLADLTPSNPGSDDTMDKVNGATNAAPGASSDSNSSNETLHRPEDTDVLTSPTVHDHDDNHTDEADTLYYSLPPSTRDSILSSIAENRIPEIYSHTRETRESMTSGVEMVDPMWVPRGECRGQEG